MKRRSPKNRSSTAGSTADATARGPGDASDDDPSPTSLNPETRTLMFGTWLRDRRLSLDLTQDRLGAEVGCSGDTIRKIELGTRRPSRQLAELLAGRFEIPEEEMHDFVLFARSRLPLVLGPSVASGSLLYSPWRRAPRPSTKRRSGGSTERAS